MIWSMTKWNSSYNTINQMRKDTLERNANAKNESKTWRVVNEIIRPKSTNKITIRTPEGDLTDETDVAATFNIFFVDKISTLKETIDLTYIKNLLTRIDEKMKNKKLKFRIKTVTLATVKKTMNKMVKKKSRAMMEFPRSVCCWVLIKGRCDYRLTQQTPF